MDIIARQFVCSFCVLPLGSINGENIHYGTPINPCAVDRVPGGSSSGSAVAVGAKLVDFALGTDTGGSVRVPASYCGIYGFRPSHGIITTSGVVPMAQSFDTVGWFARDVTTLMNVGKILQQWSDDDNDGNCQGTFGQLIIAEDCFELLDVPSRQLSQVLVSSVEKIFGSGKVKYTSLGKFIEAKVPSLKQFVCQNIMKQEDNIPSLAAIASAMRLLQRYEFKINHGEWVCSVKPKLGPGIAQRVVEALETTDENTNAVLFLKKELITALNELLGDYGILAMPTVPGPPPKLQTDPKTLESFRSKAFSLLSLAGMSGFCQVSIPLGMYEDLPIAVSLLAKHSSDRFLLRFLEAIYKSFSKEL